MKQYVITPRDWNESKHDYIADYNAEETATTYADAIRMPNTNPHDIHALMSNFTN